MAKDGWWQVVSSLEDSIVEVSQRPERRDQHGMGGEENREGVPGRRNSTAKGTVHTAAFSDAQTTMMLPFDKY